MIATIIGRSFEATIFRKKFMEKITEQSSHYDDLEKKDVGELLECMNHEDRRVPEAVGKCLPQIEKLISEIVVRMKRGGRLFYIGAGTSGRLGILDASEVPPTFGVPHGWVVGLIAGGDRAIRRAVEAAEDQLDGAWNDLSEFEIGPDDVLVGIAASGTTPYVVGGLRTARQKGILTGCIVCNHNSPVAQEADIPIEVIVGPEFLTGSTRLKSGTAQKLVLNMITTITMIQLGRVKGNKLYDMQLTNAKLVDRGTRMIREATGLSAEEANAMLLEHGSVRKAVAAVV